MTRQGDAKQEDATRRRYDAIVKVVERDLVIELNSNGVQLHGFSVRLGDWEALITLRATVNDVRSVAFVGGDNLGSALLKAVRESKSGSLRWRPDSFAERN